MLVLLAAVVAFAFTADHPLVLAALAVGGAGIALVAGRRRAVPILAAASLSALGLVLVTPLLGANGDLILAELPAPPLLDGQLTAEEVAAGAGHGLRLVAVTAIIGAFLFAVDQDRLLALAMRLAPRSALACALAARALPALARDAASLGETARARGVRLRSGSWLGRGARAVPLLVPLVGSSLERSLDVAEAMTIRGYGSGPRTRVEEPGYRAADVVVLAASGAIALLLAIGLVLGGLGYSYYPVLPSVLVGQAWLLAALALAALAAVAAVVRR
jgi:energy-coupling factor transport system permease protein